MSVIQFKQANCRNCYKCIRSCPIKAISFNNEQASIIEEECVLCGHCLVVCPQNAKSVKNSIDLVKNMIKKGLKVYASLAPSFPAAFSSSLFSSNPFYIIKALKKLGFEDVFETSAGAAEVSAQYSKIIKQKFMKNIITTSCPTVNLLIEKHYPELADYMAPVVSPMIAHGKMLKKTFGKNIKVIFIGPCLSKKYECNDLQHPDAVDAVITFEELEEWLKFENIDIYNEYGDTEEDASEKIQKAYRPIKNISARFYPAPGGIIKTLDQEDKKIYKCISVDGIERCIEILECLKNQNLEGYFLEMNSCSGGCLGGPCISAEPKNFLQMRENLVAFVKKTASFAKTAYSGADADYINETLMQSLKPTELSKKFFDKSVKKAQPDENTIRQILSKTGKYSLADELNCGACGYNTCREKALGVYYGKADVRMCLPYMKQRAESISNIIIATTPNAIIALNKDLAIQEVNASAERILKISARDVYGKNIYEVLNCSDFEEIFEKNQSVIDKKYTYDDLGITVEQSVLFVPDQNIYIIILRDITKQEKQQKQLYKMRAETVETAQKVIEKQMRVAQEIASLLGETTAETKVALTKLKNSILAESGDET